MPSKVTDPALLAKLNGGGSATAQKVTDPALLAKLNGQSASVAVTPDIIDTGNPMVQGKPSAPDPNAPDIFDQLSAGFTSGVNSIPIAGPATLNLLERAKAGIQGRSTEDVAATDRAQVDRNPVASAVGGVAGNVLPLLAGGEIPVVGKALGMAGNLAERMGFGLISGGTLSGLDALARGSSPDEAKNAAIIGAGAGGAFPLAARGLGELASRFTGRSLPKDASNLARALADDSVPVAQVPQRLADLGPDAMLMDLGPNLQRQAGAVASVPGPGQKIIRDAIAARGDAASGRVAADVAATIGTGPEIGALKSSIVDAQSKAADPLYAAVRDVPVDVSGGSLKAVLSTPLGKGALAQAKMLAANDGYTAKQATVGVMDYVKRALDDVASSAARTGKNNVARQARNMAKAITASVDKVEPGYKAARNAFAGPAQVLDALDAGAGVFSKEMSPAQLRNELAGMSTSERQAFLHGAQSQVEAMMGNAVNDVAGLRNTFRKGWNEAKLRILLGDPIANDLLKRIDRELVYGATAGVATKNSETAARQAAQAEVAPELGRTPRPQGLTGLAFSAFDAARNALQGVKQPKINASMARALASGNVDPALLQAIAKGKVPGVARIAPALPGLLSEQQQHPLYITVNGSN